MPYVQKRTPIERFMARVVVESNGCWIWQGYCLPKGYGQFNIPVPGAKRSKTVLAHRWSYEHHHGSIQNGLLVCHKCDTPSCVNPAHLFIGTNTDNMRDAASKGRTSRCVRPQPFGEDAHNAKLNAEQAKQIRELRGRLPQRKIAELFGISQTTVSKIQTGKQWKRN